MWGRGIGCGKEEMSMERGRNFAREGSEWKSSWEPSRNEKMASVSGNCVRAEVWHEVEVGRG